MRTVIYLCLFLFLLIAILSLPSVQNKIVNTIIGGVSKSINGTILVGKSDIDIYSGVSLEDISVVSDQDTIMTLDLVKISPRSTLIALVNSVRNKQGISLSDVILNGVVLNIHRREGDAETNLERFIGLDKERDTSSTSAEAPEISFIRLRDFVVNYDDEVTSETLNASFEAFEIDVNKIDTKEGGVIDISNIMLIAPRVVYQSKKITASPIDEKVTEAESSKSTIPQIKIKLLSVLDGYFEVADAKGETQIGKAVDLTITDLSLQDVDDWFFNIEKVSGDVSGNALPYASIAGVKRKGEIILLERADLNIKDSKLNVSGEISGVTGLADMSKAIARVRVNPSIFYLKDLFPFSEDLKKAFVGEPIADKRIQIEGDFDISDGQFVGQDLSFWLNGLHHFEGNISFDKSEPLSQSLLNANVDRLYTDVLDLAQMSSKFKIPKELSRLETIDFSGSFDGFLNDFVANGLLLSPLGKANLDIKFDLSGVDSSAVSYNGFLSLDSFDLRKMTLNEDFGFVSAKVNIDNGVGSSLAASSADIKAVIDQFEFKEFEYQDAVYEGKLSSRVIDGKFSIKDEELDFNFDGKVDVSGSIPIFDFKIEANKINFCQLNITEFPCELAFTSDINLSGDNIKNLDGIAFINNATLRHDTSVLHLDTIEIRSKPGVSANSFAIKSDFVDFDINGRFNLLQVFQNSLDRIIQNVENHNKVWGYKQGEGADVNQDYRYSLLIKNATPLFQFLNIDVEQEGVAIISGGQKRESRQVDMKAIIPRLSYNDMSASSIVMNLESSDGQVRTHTEMSNLRKGSFALPSLNLDTDIRESSATWDVNYFYDSYNNAKLSGSSILRDEGYFTVFENDNIVIDSSRWNIVSEKGVGIFPKSIDIPGFTLTDGERFVSLSDINNVGIEADINDFELKFINSIIDYDKTILEGSIKSQVSIENLYDDLVIQGYLDVDDFTVNGDDFGRLQLKAQRGVENTSRIDIDLSIEKDTQNLYATGYADLDASELDVEIDIQDYPMSFFEYIIEDGISETVGTTDIKATIKGPLSDLKMAGAGIVKNAGVKVDFLGAFYRMENQSVTIDESFIDFTGVELIDALGNKATITGGLRHKLLADIRADLDISSPRFIGLSTTSDDNPLYYGNGVGAIDISFRGPFDAIDIIVAAELQDLTHLYIPLGSNSYEYDESFIVFDVKEEAEEEELSESLAELLKDQGVDFEMSLTFTPQAKVSVIYDEETSNVLVGTGEGNLQMNIKRDGEFTAYGDYNILDGEYLYTAYGLIAKPFIIRDGGRVTWTGDPFNATLDVTAEYPSLRAPLENLISEFGQLKDSELSTRRVIDLKLILTGQLFNPNIDFDITFPELIGDVRTYAQNKVRTLKATENGINNQVVGLLFFNNFLPDNNGLAAISAKEVGQTGTNTITQFLTNQLSSLFSDYLSSKLGDDDFISAIDFEIGVAQNTSLLGSDVGVVEGLLDVVPDEVQLNLRNHFKNDNFVLNIGGNYVRDNQFGQLDNYVTGDFSLDWYITEDRRLKLRFYGKYDYDDAQATRRQRYGFGINYRKEFGSITNLDDVIDDIVDQIQNEKVKPEILK